MAATDVAHPRADAPAEHKRTERPVLTGAQMYARLSRTRASIPSLAIRVAR